jgi:hypothetical protein
MEKGFELSGGSNGQNNSSSYDMTHDEIISIEETYKETVRGNDLMNYPELDSSQPNAKSMTII